MQYRTRTLVKSLALSGMVAATLALAGCGEPAPVAPAVAPAPVAPAVPAPAPAPAPAADVDGPAVAEIKNKLNTGETISQDDYTEAMREELSERGVMDNYGVSDGQVQAPGALDPDAYQGGESSGDTQRQHLIEQGLLSE